MSDLEVRIRQYIADSDTHMGVALRHIESGEEIMIDADMIVPLASVVKIPVIIAAFEWLRQDRFRLADRWTLHVDTKSLGSGILRDLDDGLNLTVKDLLVLMTIVSDNTATDMLMKRIGLQNIDDLIHQNGLANIHVAHTLTEIFTDMLPSSDPTQDRLALAQWEAENGVRRDGFSYSLGADNNVGTPRDLTRLIEMIFKGEILDRASCDAILDIMMKQQVDDRLPRFLPDGTQVANKTGSFSGIRNDCALIYINDHSHVAVTILSTWDHAAVRGKPIAESKRYIEIDSTMGMIGLAAYQAFA